MLNPLNLKINPKMNNKEFNTTETCFFRFARKQIDSIISTILIPPAQTLGNKNYMPAPII